MTFEDSWMDYQPDSTGEDLLERGDIGDEDGSEAEDEPQKDTGKRKKRAAVSPV